MKIVLVGANGVIGKIVEAVLLGAGHEVIAVGRSSGEYRVNMVDRISADTLFKAIGPIDACAVAAGEVAFKPLSALTGEDFLSSFSSKFLGQVNLLQASLPYLKDAGSFTMISGVTAREPIRDGAAAASVSRALEGFAMAAATELPRGIRLNVISPEVLVESMEAYKDYFAGHKAVSGADVGAAYLKAISGCMTGQTLIP